MQQTIGITIVALLCCFDSPARAQTKQVPQAPQAHEGRIVSRATYQRLETLLVKAGEKGPNDTAPATATYRTVVQLNATARSETQCTWTVDEWGSVSILCDKTRKPTASGHLSRNTYEHDTAMDRKSGSIIRDNRSGEYTLGDGNILGIGEIINAPGAPGQLGTRIVAGFHVKGIHDERNYGDGSNYHEHKPIDRSDGFNALIYPSASQGKIEGGADAITWFGASTQKLPNGGLIVSIGGSKQSKGSHGQKISEVISAVVELLPGKPIPADMEIAPVDPAGYDQYIPSPVSDDPAVTKLFGQGQTLSFLATIKPKNAKDPAPPGVIDFHLDGVSHHKGICGNYPHGASEQDGLVFAPGGDVQIDPQDPRHAYTKSAVTSSMVLVKANETGAYGHLLANCNELALTAIYKRTNQPLIDIPRDDNHNHVADAWEKANGVLAKNYPADWDEEAAPAGKNKGDGFTFYEEYRGFIAKDPLTGDQSFQRLPPTVKKLFIYPTGDDAALYTSAAKTWALIAGIQPYFIPTINQLMDDNNDPIYPTWVNFNSDTDDGTDFGPKQHIVLLRNSSFAGAGVDPGTWGITKPKDGSSEGPFTPNDIRYVAVFRDEIARNVKLQIRLYSQVDAESAPNDFKWMSNHNATAAQFAAILNDPGRLAHLYDEAVGFTVIHELGHATGAEHHGLGAMRDAESKNGGALPDGKTANSYYASGSPTCPMYYWANHQNNYFVPFALGDWDPSLNGWLVPTTGSGLGAATAWKFCSDDARKISLHN